MKQVRALLEGSCCCWGAGVSLPKSTCAAAFPVVEHQDTLWLKPSALPHGQPFDASAFDPYRELHGELRGPALASGCISDRRWTAAGAGGSGSRALLPEAAYPLGQVADLHQQLCSRLWQRASEEAILEREVCCRACRLTRLTRLTRVR